jgi:hypothetical protein
MKECRILMQDYESNYDNPVVLKKMRYIRQLSFTIKSLTGLADKTIKTAYSKSMDPGMDMDLKNLFKKMLGMDPGEPDPEEESEARLQMHNDMIYRTLNSSVMERLHNSSASPTFNAAANIKSRKPVHTQKHEQRNPGTNGTDGTDGTNDTAIQQESEQPTENNEQRNPGTNGTDGTDGTENPETNDSTVQPNREQRTTNNEQRKDGQRATDNGQRKCYQKQKKTARHKKHH